MLLRVAPFVTGIFAVGEQYHTETAKTEEEARKLIEKGFEYVCTTPDKIMLFPKRK